MAVLSLSLHSKQPKRAVLSFDRCYVEVMEYPRADRAVITWTEDGRREEVHAGEEAYAFAIDAGGEAVGSIQLTRQGNIHRRTAELGYYVVRRLWGSGVCTEAVRQICRFAFENTDLLRVYAEPFADNAASCRVLEKAGFRLEGVMRRNAVKNGVVRDMRLYSLVREDLECIGS